MKGSKQLYAKIVTMLPDNWSESERLKFFEGIAADYRKKSRDKVYKSDKVKPGIDYSPTLNNGKG